MLLNNICCVRNKVDCWGRSEVTLHCLIFGYRLHIAERPAVQVACGDICKKCKSAFE